MPYFSYAGFQPRDDDRQLARDLLRNGATTRRQAPLMTVQKINEARDNVIATIRKVADNTNVDFNYLLAQAKIESGLNPAARASSSSALGLYQFTSGTWLNMVRQHGDKYGLDTAAQALRDQTMSSAQREQVLSLRKEPEISSAMAARFALDNAKALVASGHTSIGPTELYLAHFLGASGANTFLNGLRASPLQPAAAALPAAAEANPSIFYNKGSPRSFREIHELFAQKFGFLTASADSSASTATSDPSQTTARTPQPLTSSKIREIVKATFAAASTSAPSGQGDTNATPVSQDVMIDFLKGFSQGDTTPGLTPLESAPKRDASQGATNESRDNTMPSQNVSPLAMGARLILRSVDQTTQS